MIKLYLDDIRTCPDGWTLARSVAEAKALLLTGDVSHASLDHDLGHGCAGGCWDDSGDVVVQLCNAGCACGCHATGYDLVKWMAETSMWPLHKPLVHSANPVGRANMLAVIDRYFPRSS